MWEVSTGREIRTLSGHSSSVNAVAIAPDGKVAISGSRDNTLKVWEVATGRLLTTFTADHFLLCCAITPDGPTVVAGDASGRVYFLAIAGTASEGNSGVGTGALPPIQFS